MGCDGKYHRSLCNSINSSFCAINWQSKNDRSAIHAIVARDRCTPKGPTMAKGKNAKKEVKKPKKEKPKATATAGVQGTKSAVSITGSK
jgi:hypothetical protein